MSSLVIWFNRLISDKQLDTTFSSHMNCFTVEEVFWVLFFFLQFCYVLVLSYGLSSCTRVNPTFSFQNIQIIRNVLPYPLLGTGTKHSSCQWYSGRKYITSGTPWTELYGDLEILWSFLTNDLSLCPSHPEEALKNRTTSTPYEECFPHKKKSIINHVSEKVYLPVWFILPEKGPPPLNSLICRWFVYIFFCYTIIAATILSIPNATKATKHCEYSLISFWKRMDVWKREGKSGRRLKRAKLYPVPRA